MRNYFTIVCLIVCLNSYSQANKGKVYIDAMSNMNWAYSGKKGHEESQIQLKTGVGMFVTDKFILGGLLDFSYYRFKSSKAINSGIGVFSRLYINDSRLKLYLYGELDFIVVKSTYLSYNYYGYSTQVEYTSGLAFAAGPGLEYELNDFVSIEGTLAPVYLSFFKNEGDRLSIVMNFGFNFRF